MKNEAREEELSNRNELTGEHQINTKYLLLFILKDSILLTTQSKQAGGKNALERQHGLLAAATLINDNTEKAFEALAVR